MTMGVIQGGLPSEQTADRFASLFLYHALPVLASCGLASIKAHREYLAGAPQTLSPPGGMGHDMTMSVIQGGLPSEQTADRFASLFLYHALPVLASCGLASIKAHREYLAGAPQTLSPPGGMGHDMTMSVIQGGLPSEQTADRFASLFLYHILPLEVMIMLKYEVSLPFSLETRNNFTYIDKKVV